MKMEQTECSEMSVYKLQTPGYHQTERIEHDYVIYVKCCLLQKVTNEENLANKNQSLLIYFQPHITTLPLRHIHFPHHHILELFQSIFVPYI